MKSKNTGEIYNRLSFRSPFRKTNLVKSTSQQKIEPPDIQIPTNNTTNNYNNSTTSNITTQHATPIIVSNTSMTSPIVVKQNNPAPTPMTTPITTSKMNDRVSFRSPINKQKREAKKEPENLIYSIVTQTPSGEQVQVPTADKCSFIKFKDPEIILAQPIKVEIKKELMSIKRCKFDEAIIIYENNQVYYLDKIKKEKDEDVVLRIIKDIEHLEHWFCRIAEPKPKNKDDIDDWKLRNQFKKEQGYSKYFNIELLPYTNYK